uniref:Uncharacterized protein n=1 Tax=Sus scrofa TaxID=9823 RepID=A0A4X1V240_PIG
MIYYASKVGLKEVEAIRMAKDVLDALRQVLEEGVQSSKLYQHPWPLGFPCFCSCGFNGYTSPLGPLLHLSFFVLQPVHSLFPSLLSQGTEFTFFQESHCETDNFFFFSLFF